MYILKKEASAIQDSKINRSDPHADKISSDESLSLPLSLVSISLDFFSISSIRSRIARSSFYLSKAAGMSIGNRLI